MKHVIVVLALTAGLASCARNETYPLGTDVMVVRNDNSSVSGRLVEVKQDRLVVQRRDGGISEILKSQITSLKALSPGGETIPNAEEKPAAAATTAPSAPPAVAEATPPPAVAPASLAATKPRPAAGTRANTAAHAVNKSPSPETPAIAPATATDFKEPTPPPPPPPPLPEFRELTIHAGTTLSATLTTPLGSDTSKVEDTVRATLRSAVSIDGIELLPPGATITGHVTRAEQAAKVKGRALLAFRFNSVDLHSGSEHISTQTITREAASTKGKDATKIGIGAGAGAIIGGIVGGGSGAATGAAIGGGAGTATVLATRGDEVSLPAGTPVTVTLAAPLTIRVEIK
ncbi:MAG: hypothetical protein ACJ731_05995 [Vicinamibacterales bacterium]